MREKSGVWLLGVGISCVVLGYIALNVPESFRERYFGADRKLNRSSETKDSGQTAIGAPRTEPETSDVNREDNMVSRTDLESIIGSEVIIESLVGKQVGDIVLVPVPQESVVYEGTVEEVDHGPSGATHLVGSFALEGATYRFVFTVGQSATFGTLGTPHDRYQYQAMNGQGRMVSVTEINRNRDFTRPDYVIPEPVTTKK